jgi:hypothetical protein
VNFQTPVSNPAPASPSSEPGRKVTSPFFRLALSLAIGLVLVQTVPSAAQAAGASAGSAPAFAVTPPNPAPPPPPLSAAPSLGWRSKGPSVAEINRLTPDIEVWRAGAVAPQRPKSHGRNRFRRRVAHAFISGNEPVLVRLQFDPSASGKAVIVRAAPGITLEPSGEVFQIRPTGECVVAVTLDPALRQGHMTFYSEGIVTTLPFSRTPARVVEARENRDAEGQE